MLCFGLMDAHFGLVKSTKEFLFFDLICGGLFAILGTAGIVFKREWEMNIDSESIQWKEDGHLSKIQISNIMYVHIEEGDGRNMIIETKDGLMKVIPGECYGSAQQLRDWLKLNFREKINFK